MEEFGATKQRVAQVKGPKLSKVRVFLLWIVKYKGVVREWLDDATIHVNDGPRRFLHRTRG